MQFLLLHCIHTIRPHYRDRQHSLRNKDTKSKVEKAWRIKAKGGFPILLAFSFSRAWNVAPCRPLVNSQPPIQCRTSSWSGRSWLPRPGGASSSLSSPVSTSSLSSTVSTSSSSSPVSTSSLSSSMSSHNHLHEVEEIGHLAHEVPHNDEWIMNHESWHLTHKFVLIMEVNEEEYSGVLILLGSLI